MGMKYNKGEWSELYAFIKLLKEGRIYAADQNANRIADQFLPIIRIIREEKKNYPIDYFTGKTIRIFQNGTQIAELSPEEFTDNITALFDKIFAGAPGESAFEIPKIQPFMDELHITKVKASSLEKVDMEMQIHDFHTGFSPKVGFSIKSDVGSAPTLLNSGKNTRFRYHIKGLTQAQMQEVNSIDKSVSKEYMKDRFKKLSEYAESIKFEKVIDETYEDNLILIDSNLPEIVGNMIIQHYLNIDKSIYNCLDLTDLTAKENPLKYRRTEFYAIKFKKLITA
ncbi:MAG: HpaII family restriction endonuclease, partial [Clostridia bacterium]|nr:HpaII family restriction endonuclease [Clostridia bacterium]